MTGTYWSKFTARRVTRRRALVGGSSLAASAAFLAACGGDDDDDGGASTGSTSTGSTGGSTGSTGATGATGSTGGGSTGATGGSASSGLLAAPVDTTSQAVAGGTLRDFQNADMLHFDILAVSNNPVINFSAVFAYPRLLKFKSGTYPNAADGSIEGETATSYEISGDRTQVVFKIREGMKWDSREPTNGRPIDTEDILFSWNKYASLNASAADLVYNAETAPGAPIESISAPDDQTIVMQLKQFDSSLIQLFAAWDHFYVMPRESDGQFDPQSEIRGHGPWLLDEYVPSASVRWRRNPDYYVENRPFPEFLQRPIIPDYAQQLAQFRAGNIWTYLASPEDVIQLKKDAPDSILLEEATFQTSVSPFITFCWDGPPFTDTRMRQALSLLIDGEAFANVVENRDGYAAEGVDLQIARNTIVAPGQVGYWIDPQDEATFGENAKWLGHDIAEAKKLMDAAGYPDGVSFPVHYNSENTYGAAYHQMLDIFEGMMSEGGMTLEREGEPYAFYRSEIYDFYLKEKYAGRGDKGLTGIIHRATRGFPTVAAGLFGMMHPNGGFYHGAAPDGGNVADGDPDMIAMIEKIKGEADPEEQKSLVHDAIRYITGQMYNIPRPTNAKFIRNYWPAIGNVGLNNRYAGGNIWVEERINWWVDESQPGA